MKNVIRKTAATAATIIALSVGSAGATSISNTGPHSHNTIRSSFSFSSSVRNTNTVSVWTSNFQSSSTGSASVSDNTFGGSAITGSAQNNNTSSTWVFIHN